MEHTARPPMADHSESLSPHLAAPLLVGREREQAVLRDALAEARAGRGSLVLIGGEAGIGKTALAEATLAEAERQGALALVGRCYDLAETPPYGPWAELFVRAPRVEGVPAPDLGSGMANQVAFFARVRDYLAALAAHQTVVLLLDDLHWADPASLDLLRVVGRWLAELPLLLLATYRADELTRRHPLYQLLPLLVREARARRLDPRPLDEAGLLGMVAHHALPPADTAQLAAYLAERSEGNPFFAGELLRTLEEAGALHQGDAGWALGDLARVRVPPLLRQVLDARVDRLGEEARATLSVAAIIGQEVPFALWQAVADTEEEALLGVVERALAAQLLVELPDGRGVRFAHALVREALYEGTLALRRRALHRRVAEALTSDPAPDPDAVAYHLQRAGDERAAAWLERAGERARRAYSWRMAAERLEAALSALEQRGGDARARGWLLLRLGLLRRHSDRRLALATLAAARGLAAEAGDPLLDAYAGFDTGLVRCYLGDHLAGIADMEAAVAALDAQPPPDAATCARLRGWGLADDPAHHRGTLALWYIWTSRLADGIALGERVIAAGWPAPARSWLDGAFAPDVLRGLGVGRAELGVPEAATAILERSIAAYREAGDLGQATGSTALLLWHVHLHYRADDLAERRRLVARLAELWPRVEHTWAGGSAELVLGPLLVVEGRWAAAHALVPGFPADGPADPLWNFKLVTLFPLAHHRGDRATVRALLRAELPDGPATAPGALNYPRGAWLLPLAAHLALDEGDPAEARAWLECHDRLLADYGGVRGLAAGQLGWAAYHRAAGDRIAARRHAEGALAHAARPRQPLALLAAHRLLGELATEAGRHAEAATHLGAALALAEACAAPYERALTLLALTELRAAAGDPRAATTTLAEVRAALEPLGARPALARAGALAARLPAPAPRTVTSREALPFGLSAREAEVLRLVAQGLGNLDIAARLSLSRRTIEQHLRSVYDKLGVDNRAAATRVAVERGLA
jgi:DNA-binding CsgD family transcriptional regulator